MFIAEDSRLLSKSVSFIPVHNSADCVESMITVAKVTVGCCTSYTHHDVGDMYAIAVYCQGEVRLLAGQAVQ